jgi:hypothetical protein
MTAPTKSHETVLVISATVGAAPAMVGANPTAVRPRARTPDGNTGVRLGRQGATGRIYGVLVVENFVKVRFGVHARLGEAGLGSGGLDADTDLLRDLHGASFQTVELLATQRHTSVAV